MLFYYVLEYGEHNETARNIVRPCKYCYYWSGGTKPTMAVRPYFITPHLNSMAFLGTPGVLP